MKTVLKFIAAITSRLVLIPIFLGLTVGATWYALPSILSTFIGEWLLSIVSALEIFIITMCLIGGAILFSILLEIFKVVKSSKLNNFYTHILTWLIAICLAIEALVTFFISDSILTCSIELNLVRKILLGICVLFMLLYGILHRRLGKIIDRKLQAYDTARELSANGRSSVIWINILKAIDFVSPEFILLAALCVAFNFEVSLYFIFILAAFIIPVVGNIICDKRIKREAVKKAEEERETVVNETASAVVDLLQKQGNN